MSSTQSDKPQSIRAMMVPSESDHRTQLGEPLITIDPKHVQARARLPTIFPMAVLITMSKWLSKDRVYTHPSGVKFDTRTVTGMMDCFEFHYEAISPALDGKAREEYMKVASFIAVGQSDDSGVLTSSLLNEGAKNLAQGKNQK